MSNISVPDAIRQRRSVRRFKTDPIPEPVLKELVDLTLLAPSSWNIQPWRIVLVTSPEQKAALAAVAWNQKQIVDAPVTFVFAVDILAWEKTFEHTLTEAARLEAWPEKAVEYFRNAVPPFQKDLDALAREYAVKDALIAATHTALAAESLGLGSCFMNGWKEEGVKKVIGVEGHPDIAIALILPVGYAAEVPKFCGRLDRSHTVFDNRLA
jgi:nitroreductase